MIRTALTSIGAALLVACGPRAPMPEATATAASTTSSGTSSGSGPSTTTGSSTAATTSDTSSGAASTCASACETADLGGPVQCDAFKQDCPEGQACKPAADDGGNNYDTQICTDLPPNPDGVGDPCTTEGFTGVDSCDRGAICWYVSQGLDTCVALCMGSLVDLFCADTTTLCVHYDEYLQLCVPKCDPLDPSECPGELCIPNPYGQAGYTCIWDASGDEGQRDDPCEFANACDPGLVCVEVTYGANCDQMAQGCCQPYCDKGKPPDDPQCDLKGGQTCLDLPPDPDPPGNENVGVCGIPP